MRLGSPHRGHPARARQALLRRAGCSDERDEFAKQKKSTWLWSMTRATPSTAQP